MTAVVRVGPVALLRFTSGRSAWRDEVLEVSGDAVLAGSVLDAARR